MIIGSAQLTLRLFTPESLKEKRHIIKGLIAKIRLKYNVSIAEIDFHDKWQLCGIGISSVSTDSKVVDSTFNSIINFIEADGRIEIVDIKIDFL
jgi:uncharacterized protein